MEQFEIITSTIALTMGVAWASGINLYATVLVLGILQMTGNIVLPENLEIVAHPAVVGVSTIMFLIEFFIDKIPGVDSGWDAIQTFIRIPAGALLAAGAVGDVNSALMLAAAIGGGGVTTATHATKAGTRMLINTSPEPASNWMASLTEDVSVITGIWLALNHPWLFLGLFVCFILFLVWFLPKLWRGIKKVLSLIRSFFIRERQETEQTE